jgi:hypothetical protein
VLINQLTTFKIVLKFKKSAKQLMLRLKWELKHGYYFQIVIVLVVALVILQYCFSAVFEGQKLEPLFSIGRSPFAAKPFSKVASTSAGSLFDRHGKDVQDSLNDTDSNLIIPKCPPVPPNLGNKNFF